MAEYPVRSRLVRGSPRSILLAWAVGALIVSSLSPVAGGTPGSLTAAFVTDPFGALPASAPIRAAIESGSLEHLATTMLHQMGRSGTASRSGGASPISAIGFTPETAGAIEALAAAVHHASATLGPLSTAGDRWIERSIMLSAERATRPGSPGLRATGWLHGAPSDVRRVHASWPSALIGVAHAIDEHVPELESSVSDRHPMDGDALVKACDLLDARPAVCVSSEVANVYEHEDDPVSLIIDLGGDDRYSNMAASNTCPPPLPPTDPELVSRVFVTIDLDGDDDYRTNAICGGSPSGRGQAVGAGGLGLLIDRSGDDRYGVVHETAAARCEGCSPDSFAWGQGLGSVGAGILVDQAGDDEYTAFSAGGTNASSGTLAQGAATVGGLGLLADLGSGDDTYAMGALAPVSGDRPGPDVPAEIVTGQGYGELGGLGVLFDQGGTDEIRADASSVDEDPMLAYAIGRQPLALVSAQGVGNTGGVGMLLAGRGDTTYHAGVQGRGLAWQRLYAQGNNHGEGVGYLEDLDGNDTYEAAGLLEHVLDLSVDASCGCTGAVVSVNATNSTSPSELHAQGAGILRGGAYLRDVSGDDLYTATNTQRIEVYVRDRIGSAESPSEQASVDVVGFPTPGFQAQGAATSGAGLLRDEGGNDTYVVSVENGVDASAVSDHSVATPRVTALALSGGSLINAQGSGGGSASLVDTGGTSDRFLSSVRSDVSTAPDPRGAFRWAGPWPQLAGSGGPTSVLHAHAFGAQVIASPSLPVVSGIRGVGRWCECSPAAAAVADREIWDRSNAGSGSAGDGLPMNAPVLELNAPVTGHADGAGFSPGSIGNLSLGVVRAPVSSRLTRSNGDAIVGATIHFTLQARQPSALAWKNMWQVDAVTDENGGAAAEVPLAVAGVATGTFLYRIAATFDGRFAEGGAPRLLPVHRGEPIELTA